MVYYWVHSSQCFQGNMVLWNTGTLCPVTQCNIRLWTESLVTPPWQHQILHSYWLHAITHVNTQWHSQINPKPTNSMKQGSSWEANISSGSQEIFQIVWNPKVHYHIHKHLPPVPILSLINPIHNCSFQFLNIHFNIFLPPMPRSSMYSLSLRSVYQHPACTSPVSHTCHMPHSSRFSIQTQHELNNSCFSWTSAFKCYIQ